MRGVRFLLTASLLLALSSSAFGGPIDDLARRVLDAHESGGAAAVTNAAPRLSIDPWLVARWLETHGHGNVARALAAGVPGPERASLLAYLAQFEPDPAAGEIDGALEQARVADDVAARERAGLALEQRPTTDPVFEVQLLQARAALVQVGEGAEASLALTKQAAAAAEKLGWLGGVAEVWFERGQLAYRARDFDTQVASWRRFHAAELRREHPRRAARSHFFLANALTEVGDNVAAVDHLRSALKLYETLHEPISASLVLQNLGVGYVRTGARAAALDAMERALDLSTGIPRLRASQLLLLAGLHMQLSDPEETLRVCDQAEPLILALPERFRPGLRAELAGIRGQAYGGLEQFHSAQGALEASLALFRTLHSPDADRKAVVALDSLGWIACAEEAYDVAAEHYAEALAAAGDLGRGGLGTTLKANLCLALLKLGKRERAAALGAEALREAKGTSSHPLLASCFGAVAQCELDGGNARAALAASDQAIGHLTSLLTGFGIEQSARVREGHDGLYDTALAAAAELEDATAFAVRLEQWRIGSQLEDLDARARLRRRHVPAGLRQAEDAARLRVGAAQRALDQARHTGKRRQIRPKAKALRRAQAAVDAVVRRIQREAVRAAEILYPEPAPVTRIQGVLAADEALVLYALLSETAYAVVLRRKDVRLVVLGPVEPIEAACDAAAKALACEGKQAKARLQTLRTMLIRRLELPESVKHLVVSPDGDLLLVPFANLSPKRTVTYVPSGTAFVGLRTRPVPSGTGILGMGAARYTDRRGLHALPASRAEVHAVATATLVDAKANETAFWEALGKRAHWRAVHIACHGLIDGRRPMRSALALTMSPGSDGLLTAGEVYGREIPAELAVLSACESGRGRVYTGQGLIGLPRAFLTAGVPRVVVSLWPVDDAASAALMIKFYALWKPKALGGAGLPASKALQEAQAFIRGQPGWAHPYYWAAWVLWGLPE